MISYDEFCKLPIFKKGYIAIDDDDSVWWYCERPLYDDVECVWTCMGEKAERIDGLCFKVDTKGIKPEESLRKVGGK